MGIYRKIFIGMVIGILSTGVTKMSFSASKIEDVTIDCRVNPIFHGVNATSEKKVEILADEISFPERSVVHLRGYTQLIRGGYRVSADELIYNRDTDHVEARGAVTFESPEGDVIRTSVLEYDVKTGSLTSGPAEFLLADRKSRVLGDGNALVNAHGTAQSISFDDEQFLDLHDAQVTSCLNGEEDITFTALDIRIDVEEGVRTADRAKVKIAAPSKHKRIQEAID